MIGNNHRPLHFHVQPADERSCPGFGWGFFLIPLGNFSQLPDGSTPLRDNLGR